VRLRRSASCRPGPPRVRLLFTAMLTSAIRRSSRHSEDPLVPWEDARGCQQEQGSSRPTALQPVDWRSARPLSPATARPHILGDRCSNARSRSQRQDPPEAARRVAPRRTERRDRTSAPNHGRTHCLSAPYRISLLFAQRRRSLHDDDVEVVADDHLTGVVVWGELEGRLG